jgi:uncharacterized membrane protein
MKQTASLERAYRRVLACYPRAFREENEQEILAVLLASAEEGQRRVGLAESAALLGSALRMRLRPVDRPPLAVRGAITMMLFGAASSAANLIVVLAFSGDIAAYHLTVLGHRYTAAELGHVRPLIITLAIAVGLAEIALWLWMAQATGQGRNPARILSTVLFVLMSLELGGHFYGVVAQVLAALTWVIGLAAVWLLWRPASSAFFESARAARSPSRISGA